MLVGAQAAWLVFGALENIRAPATNGQIVADVMRMKAMRQLHPEFFAVMGNNRVDNARLHRLAFGTIVLCESLVSLVMVAGTLAMSCAFLGFLPAEPALIVATLGVLGFTLIWSAFLVGGQWFHYWAGHEGAQHTHFLLAIWGTAVLVLLAV